MFFYKALDNSRIKYKLNVSTSNISSIRAGGYADCVITPATTDELIFTLRLLRREGVRHKVIGGCTNTFFADKGYNGAIVSTRALGRILIGDTAVIAEAGVALSSLISTAAECSRSLGAELFGIPGTVGGAVRNNAGAYGREISDIFLSAQLYDTDSGKIIYLDRSDMQFSYRDSVIQGSGLILLSCTLDSVCLPAESIRVSMREIIGRRRSSQPTEPSLGSFFKRCGEDHASRIIDELGLKGERVGGAAVSERHAGFIINSGNASASDICALADRVEERVLTARGIKLQREAEYVE